MPRIITAFIGIHLLLNGFALEAINAALNEATKAALNNYWQVIKAALTLNLDTLGKIFH